MNTKQLCIIALTFTAGCATIPTGPTLAVMPAPGKPFEVFVSDDATCRQFAEHQTGIAPRTAAAQDTAGGAAIGAAAGAVAGAAIGAAAGHPGIGAGVGAGTGLLAGTAVGANSGYRSEFTLQQQYNIAYEQCMYAKGNQIPGVIQPSEAPRQGSSFPPPPPTKKPLS
jgi:Glycine-zipper domain